MERREFLVKNVLFCGGLTIFPFGESLSASLKYNDFISKRPKSDKRTYKSEEVEKLIKEITSQITDKEIAWMFENCYPNTLDTTVDYELIEGKHDTFIITGDIDAMWLRDSTAQVWPYMPLIKKDDHLRKMILGLINRQVKCVLRDPYANSFYKDLTKQSKHRNDKPMPIPGVHERKWEIDSLCYVIRLLDYYYALTKDIDAFNNGWDEAMRLIVKTFRVEQRKKEKSPYSFVRNTTVPISSQLFEGTGRPVKPTGMICSMFRPSDDATMYPYNIPANIFASISLRQLSMIYTSVFKDKSFANECFQFANEIDDGINKYGISKHFDYGKIYAYEVDGYGNKVFMDDANVPSLMSLPYLDKDKNKNAIYKNTRKFLLSNDNPYFITGKTAQGQASPHTGKEKIWPIGIILRAMTSDNNKEIINCLQMLKRTHAGTGFMHEAFHKDNPQDFNRSWFAWANTLFGELIIKIYHEKKELLSLNF